MGKVHIYSPSEFIDETKQVPPQYLPQLFQIVHLYKASITKKTNLESFEKSWGEAVSGKVSDISELWEESNPFLKTV